LEPRFRQLRDEVLRMIRSVATAPATVVDHMPTFTPTGNPRVFDMPYAYLQGSIAATIGVVWLVPGVDFLTSGTTFTLDAVLWASGPVGGSLVPRQGTRVA